MSDHDWYRRTTWTPKDREEFFARLQRARTAFNKSQYLRIQAYHLQAEATPPDFQAALEILGILFREAPDPSQLAPAYLQQAKCFEALGQIDEAIKAYRQAVQTGFNQHGMQTTDAPFHFGSFVVRNKLKEYYDEILRGFKGSEIALLVPASQYLFHSIMALTGQADGRQGEAQVHARRALEIMKQTETSDATIERMLSDLVAG